MNELHTKNHANVNENGKSKNDKTKPKLVAEKLFENLKTSHADNRRMSKTTRYDSLNTVQQRLINKALHFRYIVGGCSDKCTL